MTTEDGALQVVATIGCVCFAVAYPPVVRWGRIISPCYIIEAAPTPIDREGLTNPARSGDEPEASP